ncbi:Endonuclease/exonuclease/phosphatase [Phycomyces nitens]|nr:Endonuclease/exonuclease/phosphatase [Phycomyces nitens]
MVPRMFIKSIILSPFFFFLFLALGLLMINLITMRILTWNINGLTSALNYYPWAKAKSYEETRCQSTNLTQKIALVPGYDGYFSFSKNRLGYSGVAVYVKQPLTPLQTEEGITGILNESKTTNPCLNKLLDRLINTADQLDSEGRCLILDFGLFVLFNVYFPNEAKGSCKSYKADYHACVRQRIDEFLINDQEVILVGDVNAIHEPLDHFEPKRGWNEDSDSYFQTSVYRQWLDQIIFPKGPLVDACRYFHPQREGMFTWVRLDYILVSRELSSWLKAADILPNLFGSDHCPVYIDLHDRSVESTKDPIYLVDLLSIGQKKHSAVLAKNFMRFSGTQKRLDQYFSTVRPPKEYNT